MTVGKAAIKWTDELCLWESSLFLGCFYPCLSSAGGGRGKLALLLLLPPAPFACCFTKPPSAGSKRGQKHVCSVPEEQSSMWTRQRLRSAEMPSGTEPFPAQRHLPCRRSAQKGCTHCPLPGQVTGPTTISLFVLFDVRPQLLHHLTSAYFTSGLRYHYTETRGFRQGSSPFLWTHPQGQPLLQAKPGTLLLPSAVSSAAGKCINKIILLYH